MLWPKSELQPMQHSIWNSFIIIKSFFGGDFRWKDYWNLKLPYSTFFGSRFYTIVTVCFLLLPLAAFRIGLLVQAAYNKTVKIYILLIFSCTHQYTRLQRIHYNLQFTIINHIYINIYNQESRVSNNLI